MAEYIETEICKITLLGSYTLPGIDSHNIQAIADELTARMKKVEQDDGVVDTLKQSLLVSLALLAEVNQVKAELASVKQSDIAKMHEMMTMLSDRCKEMDCDKRTDAN